MTAPLDKDGGAAPMRTGDIVFHSPTGEEWVVAWADHASGYVAPCGWPECQALIRDCVVRLHASDERCRELAAELARSGRRDAHHADAMLSARERQP